MRDSFIFQETPHVVVVNFTYNCKPCLNNSLFRRGATYEGSNVSLGH